MAEIFAIQRKRCGFTLAELLVVVAIVGIMIAIALPAFVGISSGSNLDASANAVRSAAMLARQYAITHGQPAYLVLRDAASMDDAALAYRSYAVFTIDTHTPPVTQDSGAFLMDWQTLPAGIVFDDAAGGTTNIFQVSEGAGWNGAISKNNVLKIRNGTYIVQGFRPDGTGGAQTHWIFLAEGFRNESGELVRTSGQGRQIRFSISGKATLADHAYENGTIEGMGNP